METLKIKSKNKSRQNEAAQSLQWLISRNPSLNKLIEKFDLQIVVKPSKTNNHE